MVCTCDEDESHYIKKHIISFSFFDYHTFFFFYFSIFSFLDFLFFLFPFVSISFSLLIVIFNKTIFKNWTCFRSKKWLWKLSRILQNPGLAQDWLQSSELATCEEVIQPPFATSETFIFGRPGASILFWLTWVIT